MGAAETHQRPTAEQRERELEKREKELEKTEKELEKRERELDRRERELDRELYRRERDLDRRERELDRRLMDRIRPWSWKTEDGESELERMAGGLTAELRGSNELDHPNMSESLLPAEKPRGASCNGDQRCSKKIVQVSSDG